VETTGTKPYKHSLIGIGAIFLQELYDKFDVKGVFSGECRPWEGAQYTDSAMKTIGFDEARLNDPSRKSLEMLMREFTEFSEKPYNKTIAGHNPTFDLNFLRLSAYKYNVPFFFPYRTIDLHTLCYTNMLTKGIPAPVNHNKTDINSDRVFSYVGLPLEPRPHVGINGAKWESEAFSRLIYGKNLLEEFKNYEVPVHMSR